MTESWSSKVAAIARGFIPWCKANSRRVLISMVVGGAVSWVANVGLIAFKYDGWQKVPPGSPATGPGNFVGGSMFWGMASALVFGAFSHRRRVGKEQFWRDVRGLPDQIAGMFRRDGRNAGVHVLWGAGFAMLSTTLVSPALGGVMAIGILATAPMLLGRLLTSAVYSVWSRIVQAVAPTTKHPADPGSTFGVAMVGAAASLAVAFFIPSRTAKLIAGGVLCAAAFALTVQKKPATAASTVAIAAACFVFADLVQPQAAFAHDGGYRECGNTLLDWFRRCPGLVNVLISAAGGGIAGGALAPVGGYLGGLDPSKFPSEPPNPFDPSIREQIDKFVKDGLVWDPGTLSWRPVRPGEVPPPPDAPEEPPPYERQHPRDKIPPTCLGLYDRYVRAQADALSAQNGIQAARDKVVQAQTHLNAQLAKLTLRTGYDVGSLLGGGVAGVHDAGVGIGQRAGGGMMGDAKPPPGMIGQALAAARQRLAQLTATAKRLADEVFDLSGRVSRAATTARNLVDDAARLARSLDEATGASEAAEKAVAKLREWLNAARSSEALVGERNRTVAELAEAESKLRVHERALRELGELQMWAGQMKGAFDGEAARLFRTYQDDVMRIDRELSTILQRGGGRNPLPADSARFHQLIMEKGALPSKSAWQKFDAIGWEQYAANQDPAKFQDWILRARGASVLDRPPAMDALMRRVVELRKIEADLEKRISEVRGSLPPGRTAADLTQEVAEAEAKATTARQTADNARRAHDGAKSQADDAAKAVTEAEGARTAKEAELKGVQGEIASAESEIKRLELGAGSDQPGGILDGMRSIARAMGNQWVRVFGAGQSPEEVAAVLQQCRQSVVDAYANVTALEQQYASGIGTMNEIKNALDACLRENGAL